MPLFGNLISMGAGGGVVVNAGGADIDTRIEGDTDTNALVIDASTDSVGIGTATPGAKLDVNGAVKIAGDNGMSALRIRGRKTSAGAPASGTWTTGDAVIDSLGVWHVCITGGTPGTWV